MSNEKVLKKFETAEEAIKELDGCGCRVVCPTFYQPVCPNFYPLGRTAVLPTDTNGEYPTMEHTNIKQPFAMLYSDGRLVSVDSTNPAVLEKQEKVRSHLSPVYQFA